ncbi:class I SAM-dependent methyltransferase [Microbacterium sp. MPKO10]|uniref:class I SAM-dependent methyltransferase n=1 Tax=Microbacterium sp. MPKO10 TaxID=2989818 RepID=UPI002235A33E|nr:class I SAM-dependent methyltransferase [Microbacterium sp. MPKO10]MCW4460075.1 class I SAM-dependent methyltransferase [Microbacterium sp. MPKO10]
MTDQRNIDDRIRTYYRDQFDEDARLTTRSAQGRIEHRRTQELIAEYVVSGRVLDIGGATGVHALPLQKRGLEVELIEPVPEQVEMARAAGISARVGDARDLPFADDEFDAALMLGPLYHLADGNDRQTALRQAMRVTRSGGYLFAAALSRAVAFQAATLTRDTRMTDDLANLFEKGRPLPGGRFPAGHFHTAEELASEITEAGLELVDIHGVEGPAGLLAEQLSVDDDETVDAAHMLARAGSVMPGLRDLSIHLLAIARVP